MLPVVENQVRINQSYQLKKGYQVFLPCPSSLANTPRVYSIFNDSITLTLSVINTESKVVARQINPSILSTYAGCLILAVLSSHLVDGIETSFTVTCTGFTLFVNAPGAEETCGLFVFAHFNFIFASQSNVASYMFAIMMRLVKTT